MIKKFILITFLSFLALQFPKAVFAESTGMPTSFKVTYKSINAEQIQISWEPIPDVREYRICVANNCKGSDETKVWITIDPSKTTYIHNLSVGKTEEFWVHALMHPWATKWTYTDTRPNSLGLKWDNGPGGFKYTNNWINPFTIVTTTTTINPSIQQDIVNIENSCPSLTWNVRGKCLTAKADVLSFKPKAVVTTTTIPILKSSSYHSLTTLVPPVANVKPREFVQTIKPVTVIKPLETSIQKENQETLMFGLKISEFMVIISIVIMAFIYILLQQMLNYKMKAKRFDLEKLDKEYERQARDYELKELAKAKLNNEHEQTLKKLDHDAIKDRLEYTEHQLKDERNYSLEQQKIASHNADQVLGYVMPILQGRDAHELRMAEIKAASTNSILHPDDITEAKVKFKK